MSLLLLMEEVEEICARPRRFNAAKGINGFKDMTAELEKMHPVSKDVLELMNLRGRDAFDELVPWADQCLLWFCALSCEWSKDLSAHMMLEADTCDRLNYDKPDSEPESVTDSEDEDGNQIKPWYFKDEHLFLLDKHTSRVYDFESRIEIGRYVGEHDDLIDFYENEEKSEDESECETTNSDSGSDYGSVE